MTLLEPVVAAVRDVAIERTDHLVVFRHEVRVVEEPGPLDRADEDRDRVVGSAPRDRVQAAVEGLGARGPAARGQRSVAPTGSLRADPWMGDCTGSAGPDERSPEGSGLNAGRWIERRA